MRAMTTTSGTPGWRGVRRELSSEAEKGRGGPPAPRMASYAVLAPRDGDLRAGQADSERPGAPALRGGQGRNRPAGPSNAGLGPFPAPWHGGGGPAGAA
jgi:hypothetical protein